MKFASFAVIALLALARPARALPRLAVDAGTCSQLNQRELARLLAVELVDSAEVVTSPAPLAATLVHLECDTSPSTNVVIQVDDALTRKVVRRRVDLSRVSVEAQGRVLSIAVAELVRASWLELPSQPTAPAVVERQPAPKPARSTSFSLGVGPEVMTFGRGVAPLAGGALVGRAEPVPRFPIETGIAFAVASQTIPGGSASLQLGSLQLAGGWVFAPGQLELSGFAGLRAGWLRGRGTPDDPTHTTSRSLLLPWVGAAAGLDARLPFGFPFLAVRLQAGYSLLSVHGKVDADRAVELAGGFGIASLLLGMGR